MLAWQHKSWAPNVAGALITSPAPMSTRTNTTTALIIRILLVTLLGHQYMGCFERRFFVLSKNLQTERPPKVGPYPSDLHDTLITTHDTTHDTLINTN
jgi:hypothetical protein